MCLIKENNLIQSLVRSFSRSPIQINRLQQSDSELIRINSQTILALTTDSICEEIELGLYTNPFQIGWMMVTASISDLAAVGATPIGILLNQTFANTTTHEFSIELQRGINEACNCYNTFVLGGDTNYSSQMHMSATAIGIVQQNSPIMRIGCNSGHLLFTSGKLGNGNLFAFKKLSGQDSAFKPLARIDCSQLLLKYATCCMDTSDGAFAAIDQLMRLNNLGFHINLSQNGFISDEAQEFCSAQNIPNWFMLAGPHGEYELIFTIPPQFQNEFLSEAAKENWYPQKLGKTIAQSEIRININGNEKIIDTAAIRNLFAQTNHNIGYYVNELFKIKMENAK